MSKIKNTSKVDTQDSPMKSGILVDSHWSDNDMVVITIGDEQRTVIGSNLIRAIQNCQNVGM